MADEHESCMSTVSAQLGGAEAAALRRLRAGFNLASVIHGADATGEGGWFSALQGRLFDSPDAWASSPSPAVPAVIQPVHLSDFHAFLEAHNAGNTWFLRNHKVLHLPRVAAVARRVRLRQQRESADDPEAVRRSSRFAKTLAQLKEQLRTEKGPQALEESEPQAALNALQGIVPERYFKEDFEVVFGEEGGDVHPDSLYQQKLSDWLDKVETCLWSHTTSRAEQFFSALSDLHVLRAEVNDACTTIGELRGRLQLTRKNLVDHQLAVLRYKRKLGNLNKLQDLLLEIHGVRAVIPSVKELLESREDYGEALSQLNEAKKVLKRNLSQVHGLRSLLRQINDYEDVILERLNSKFIDLAVSWEPNGVDEGNETEKIISVSERNVDDLVARLLPLMIGFSTTNDAAEPVKRAISQYRERVIRCVRQSVQSSVSEALVTLTSKHDEDDSQPAVVNQRQVLALSDSAFLSFLDLVFFSLETVMIRAASVDKALKLALQDQGGDEGLAEQSEEVFFKVYDMCQNSIGRLFTLRMDSCMDGMSLQDFKQTYDAVISFSRKSMLLTGAPKSNSLLEGLRTQAKRFLESTHRHWMKEVQNAANRDEWKSVEIPRSIQSSVRRIYAQRPSALNVRAFSNGDGFEPSESGKSSKLRLTSLTIGNKSLKAVSSVLVLIQAVEAHLACAQQLKLSYDCLPALMDLLRMYNERTNRLVLHLGACNDRTARLKRITAKNLAMASLAITIVLELMPPMFAALIASLPNASKHFERNQRDVRNQFEQLEAEYTEHRHKIFEKIVHILSEHLHECCNPEKLSEINWDSPSQMDQPEEYMLRLTEGIKKVHKVLGSNLPPEQLHHVFQLVFALFNSKIPELYDDVRPSSSVGNVKVYIDLNQLSRCLHMLPGTSGMGSELDEFIKERFPTSRTVRSIEMAKGEDSEEKTIKEQGQRKDGIEEEEEEEEGLAVANTNVVSEHTEANDDDVDNNNHDLN